MKKQTREEREKIINRLLIKEKRFEQRKLLISIRDEDINCELCVNEKGVISIAE